MDCHPPGSSVHEISKQGSWSGLPFPSPGDLPPWVDPPNPGIKPGSPALQADSLLTELWGKPSLCLKHVDNDLGNMLPHAEHSQSMFCSQLVDHTPSSFTLPRSLESTLTTNSEFWLKISLKDTGFDLWTHFQRGYMPSALCLFLRKLSQSYGFYNSYIWMWELDHKKGWAPKNLCFQTAVLKNTLESPLDSKEIKPVNPKVNQPWIIIGRADAEGDAPILWPPDSKIHLIRKDPDARKRLKAGGEGGDRGGDGWIASLTQWPWVWANSRGQWRQGSLVCYSKWVHNESDMT